MKKTLVFIALAAVLMPCFIRAEEVALTLDQALSIALRDNRDVLLKEEELKKAKLKIDEAQSGLMPSLTFAAGANRTSGYYGKDLVQADTQVTLKQYLYRGAKTVNTIRKNKDEFEVTRRLLDKAKLELGLKVRQAFYTMALAGELAGLNQKIADNISAHLVFLEDRYNAGQASGEEILNIKASLSNANHAYQSSLNQMRAAGELLKNLLSLDSRAAVKPVAVFDYQPRELAYDQAFLKALSERPEIRQYQAQLRVDELAVEIAKAQTRPVIYAAWDYYSRTHALSGTVKNYNDYNILGVTFSWPVFDGWETKRKVEQAVIELKQTQLTREKTVSDIALELRQAYLSLNEAVSAIKAVEAELAFYKENFGQATDKYRQGIASALDLDDSRVKYDIALFNQKQAIYDYIIAKAGFDKATGGI